MTQAPLRLLDVSQMFATAPPPVPWIIEPLLVRFHVTMLAGREGTGKSMLALALAAAVGNGRSVAGLESLAPSRVLYVDAENGEGEVHRRVHALGARPEALSYASAEGFDLRHHMGLLRDLVRSQRPDVVVLDSLRSLSPSMDENDSAAAEVTIQPLKLLAREFACAILVLAHAGKGSGGAEYRGSSGLGAAVEIGFTLSRDALDPEKRTRRRLACWKMRPAAEPETRWLSLDAADGHLTITEAEAFTGGEGEPVNQDQVTAHRMGAELAESGTILAWKDLCARVPVDPGSGTAKRALALGINAELFVRVERGRYAAPLVQVGPLDGPTDSGPSEFGPSVQTPRDRGRTDQVEGAIA